MNTQDVHQFSQENLPPETLTGENVIEGFSCQAAVLFE